MRDRETQEDRGVKPEREREREVERERERRIRDGAEWADRNVRLERQ